MAEENLDNVRERIRQIDLELIAHAAERSRLVKQVGEIIFTKGMQSSTHHQPGLLEICMQTYKL